MSTSDHPTRIARAFADRAFADLELLRAAPAFGGAEVLRARRVHERGEGEPVHLALFGPVRPEITARLIAVAEAGAQSVHDQVARVLEVGEHHGGLYALAEAIEGLPVATVVDTLRKRKSALELTVIVAIGLELASLAHELHDRSDVWDADGGVGLSTVFPAGFRLEAAVLQADGRVAVRPLAAAAADPRAPTAFWAPELARRPGSAASDVFLVTQVLRALLSGDPTATGPPRVGAKAGSLGPMLAAGLAPNPDERLGLFMLVERLEHELQKLCAFEAHELIASVMEDEGLGSADDTSPQASDPRPGAATEAIRARLRTAKNALIVRWPRRGSEPRGRSPEPHLTALQDRVPLGDGSSEAIGRVFTEEGDNLGLEIAVDVDFESQSETDAIPRARVAAVLDLAAASLHNTESATQTQTQRPGWELTAESDPPWVSVSDEVQMVAEARQSPPITPSEIEGGPTVEMNLGRLPLVADKDDDDEEDPDVTADPDEPRR